MIDKKTYLSSKGLICPLCGSKLIHGGFIQIESGRAFQDMRCLECEGTWQDVYQLIDVIPDAASNT